jgi:NAD-dependent dihydropyrimidine dehydrogenase PreA subunit
MLIDEQTCGGCGECVPYCVVGAISMDDGAGVARVDLDECVECGACVRAGVCSTDSFYQQELVWPRLLRAQFSDPLGVHPKTGIPGRGTEEIKTNDVTDRVKPGYAGMAVELGRPSVGAKLADVEKVAMALSRIGVEHEPANPVTFLMTDKETGKMQDDVLQEKVLSAIVEFIVPQSKVVQVLQTLREVAPTLDTVFSLDLAVRYEPDGSVPLAKEVEDAGFALSINGKTNVGMVTYLQGR